jgi:predicted AAA+ superfamily ATPase
MRPRDYRLRRSNYLDRVARGGFPEAIHRDTPRRRRRFFESYLADILSRGVRQVADIRRADDMQRLLSLLAAQAGGLLNVNRLSNDLQLTAPTTRSYLDILETIYQIRLVPAWSSGATTRAVGRSKIIFVDSGLAHHLADDAAARAPVGGLVESFVLSELARQLTWCDIRGRLYHYRDRDGYEVDAVIESSAGQVIGIEVKAAESVRTEDFRGLRVLQRRLGERFRGGFVLYCGPESFSFGDGLICLPIAALWSADPGQAGPGGIL